MKATQQWEMLASHGHVLLAKVDSYRLKTKWPIAIAALAFILAYLAFSATSGIGGFVGQVVGWTVEKASSLVTSKPLEPTPVPAMNDIEIVAPRTNFDPSLVPKLESDVASAMANRLNAMKNGQKIEFCDTTKKIIDAWSDGVDMTAKCRVSKDGKRLYVWTFINNEVNGVNKYGFNFALIVKQDDGQVVLANLNVFNTIPLPGQKSLDPLLIPRTILMDFPELKRGA